MQEQLPDPTYALNRFTLRGQHKVDGQWKLYALVHNIEKWMNFRKAA